MPNTFATLDVPVNDGSGAPFITRALGRPKTIVFSGQVLGRYIVEGSNDGGTNCVNGGFFPSKFDGRRSTPGADGGIGGVVVTPRISALRSRSVMKGGDPRG
jgi:hypothetical protein